MIRVFSLMALLCVALPLGRSHAQSDTAVTYQGALTENGVPATGSYDIDFSLWDAPAGGNQICCPVAVNDVQVFEGRFAARLDFGADAFDNEERWLELIVNGFTLSPRQPITRAPYAIQTRGIFVDNDGKIGIGTVAPSAAISVVEDTETVGLHVIQTATNGHSALFESYGGATHGVTIYNVTDDEALSVVNDGNGPAAEIGGDVIVTGGNVGIGDTSPGARLTVTSSNESLASFIQGGTGPGVIITSSDPTTNHAALSVWGLSSNAPSLRVLGTASINVVEIMGADVAERFSATEEMPPGTVVEIDPDNPGQLRVARGVYNRRVAGVVSGAGDIPTGTIMGNMPGYEDCPAIALSGRVWVHCDATRSSIEPGALLTTSDTPGHAMAVGDFSRAHGSVIGKAMTPLARGEIGMVLVLVNLQ